MRIRTNLERIFPELGPLKVFQGDKSYTVNKDKIYLCIKNRHGQYYNDDVLCYVLLHEVAQTLCEDVGHMPQFKALFFD